AAGHWLGDCPLAPSSSAGVCFKCGSSEHTCQQCHAKVPSGEFPYAKCFICGEIGHLTRSCPDNPRGLYPRGGGCKICGSVEHLKANCPDGNKSTKVTTSAATSEARGGGVSAVSLSADALDNEGSPPVRKRQKTGGKRAKIVKF
ncbi:Zinc finger CCHC domain-containing protein 9, partial [Geodia barretti]